MNLPSAVKIEFLSRKSDTTKTQQETYISTTKKLTLHNKKLTLHNNKITLTQQQAGIYQAAELNDK